MTRTEARRSLVSRLIAELNEHFERGDAVRVTFTVDLRPGGVPRQNLRVGVERVLEIQEEVFAPAP